MSATGSGHTEGDGGRALPSSRSKVVDRARCAPIFQRYSKSLKQWPKRDAISSTFIRADWSKSSRRILNFSAIVFRLEVKHSRDLPSSEMNVMKSLAVPRSSNCELSTMLQPISVKNADTTMPRVDWQKTVRTNFVMILSIRMRKGFLLPLGGRGLAKLAAARRGTDFRRIRRTQRFECD